MFGVQFRSRTEARWAILFNELGLIWQYEPQSFTLNLKRAGAAGGRLYYLPDFWIPDPDVWLEVKPNAKPTAGEYAKCRLLCNKVGRTVYGLYGAPRRFTAYQFSPGRVASVPDVWLSPEAFFKQFIPVSVDPLLILPAVVKSSNWVFDHE